MTRQTILIVEDDTEIRDLIAELLAAADYTVAVAGSGAAMDAILAERQVDLFILDLMLPGEDGLAICRRLRQTRTEPIIMLTARTEEADRVIGLELGADDYLGKPFGTQELLARVRAVLRRVTRQSGPASRRQTAWRFEGWDFDLRRRCLRSADGTKVPLTGSEFDLLAAFCEHPHEVLSREQIVELTRGRPIPSLERSVDIQVSRLRRKIEADSAYPVLIQTVRSGGYVFTAHVIRAHG